MNTLKKNNISQGSSINSPVPVNKNCDLPPFFNEDYFGHVVVQTIAELNDIPCKLRQDGMVATVVQDSYSEWQLQSSRTGYDKCDNRAWIRVSKGDAVYDGNNLMIFSDLAELGRFLQSQYAKQGQLIYVVPENRYFRVKVTVATKTLEDPFPEKLTKPMEKTSSEDDDLLIPVYKDNQPPLWKSYSEFGRVHTVNGLESDDNKNINIGLDEVLKVGPPKEEDTLNSVASTKRVLLYDPRDNKAYWKKVSEIGKINTVDGIGPVAGNVDLSSRYYTKTETKDIFISKPKTYSVDQELDIVLQDSTTGESFKIKLGDVPKLKEYFSPDNTLVIDEDEIRLNVSNLRFDTEVLDYDKNMLPLDIQGNQDFAEITDVVVNGEPLHSEMYRLTSKRSITILENYTELTTKYNQQPNKLYVTIKGIKFFN